MSELGRLPSALAPKIQLMVPEAAWVNSPTRGGRGPPLCFAGCAAGNGDFSRRTEDVHSLFKVPSLTWHG